MQKIAILGGGIGALATAEITNDPDWQKGYDITIYQMGWRLGGKGASGRNQAISDRIQEHGIHLWMGFYENAFHLIRQAYDEAHKKNLMPASPFTDARKAFSPMTYTPMMEQVGADWKFWNINWLPDYKIPLDPASGFAFPGEDSTFTSGEEPPTPLGFVKLLLDHCTSLLDEKKKSHPILVDFTKAPFANYAVQSAPCRCCQRAEPPGVHTALHCITSFVHTLPQTIGQDMPGVHLSYRNGSRTSTPGYCS